MEAEPVVLKRRNYLIYAVFTLVAAFLYMLLAHFGDIWADEAYSLAMIRHSYGEMLRITAADVHPPLYYILLKLFTAPFSYSLLSVQIFTLFPYLCILFFGGLSLHKLFSEKTALLFMGLYLLYPFALQYSGEIRMYTWAAAFVFFCGIFAVRCIEQRGWLNWALFTLFGLAAAYTHYFALVSAGIIYILLFCAAIKQKNRALTPWILCAIVTVAAYIPWLQAFITQLAYKVEHEYWIPPITISFLLGFVRHLFGSEAWFPYVFFCTISFAAALVQLLRAGERREKLLALGALSVPLGTIAVGVLAGLLVRPVFVIHYVMPAVPLMIVFLAVSIEQSRKKVLRRGILVFFLIGGLINYSLTLRNEILSAENSLNESFVGALSADCYVCDTGESYTGAVLAYYASDKPVYGEIYTDTPEANAFDNQIPIEDYIPGTAAKVVLLVQEGSPLSEIQPALIAGYQVEYLGSVTAGNYTSDVYGLTKDGSL